MTIADNKKRNPTISLSPRIMAPELPKMSAKKKKQLRLVTGKMAPGDGPLEADRPSDEVDLTAAR
jgi:hypothetical protein